MRERFLVLTFWAAVTFAFAMAVQPYPIHHPISQSDKILHMVAFMTLAGLAALAYPRASLLRILVGLALFGALIEAVQAVPALGRDSSIADWAADVVATMVVLVIVILVRRCRTVADIPPG